MTKNKSICTAYSIMETEVVIHDEYINGEVKPTIIYPTILVGRELQSILYNDKYILLVTKDPEETYLIYADWLTLTGYFGDICNAIGSKIVSFERERKDNDPDVCEVSYSICTKKGRFTFYWNTDKDVSKMVQLFNYELPKKKKRNKKSIDE